MAKLYYGNGDCTIEGTEIRGVEIRYHGSIKIEKTAGDNFVLNHKSNGIMIFPVGEGYLNDLFKYSGDFRIISVIVAGKLGESVPCTIKRIMDYSELIDSTSETMTIKSEDLSVGNRSIKPIRETSLIIENQRTYTGQFFLQNGNPYDGDYHIHLKDSSCMSGAVHSEDSQDLYFKQVENGEIIDKLVPTKNPSNVPPGLKIRQKRERRQKRRRNIGVKR